MLSVELELTEWTEGKEALGGWDLVLAPAPVPAPTDAELLHSERQTQVSKKHRFAHRQSAGRTRILVQTEASAAEVDPPLLPHALLHQAVEYKDEKS